MPKLFNMETRLKVIQKKYYKFQNIKELLVIEGYVVILISTSS